MNLPVSTTGVNFEKTTALLDAKWMIDERGEFITFYERGETNVQRDKYNSLKQKEEIIPGIEIKAIPELNPIDKQIEKAGLREKVEVILYTAMQDWIDINIDPRKIDMTRSSVTFRNESYKIKDTGFINHFGDTQLNITLGLFK